MQEWTHFNRWGQIIYFNSFSITYLSYLLFTYYFLKILFIFREKGREGEREREKHQCVVASHMPPSGDLACSPGMWPRLGMELTALWFAGWHSIRWAILARTKLSFVKLVYFPLTCCTRLLSQFLVLNVYSLKNIDISYFIKIFVYASVLYMCIYIYIYMYIYLFIYFCLLY